MAVDFGYSVVKSRAVDLDTALPAASRRLAAAVPSLAACIGCGGCSAACTAGAIAPFNPRRAQSLWRRGLIEEVDTEKCMLCGKCRLVCPRRVDTRRTMITLYDELLLF